MHPDLVRGLLHAEGHERLDALLEEGLLAREHGLGDAAQGRLALAQCIEEPLGPLAALLDPVAGRVPALQIGEEGLVGRREGQPRLALAVESHGPLPVDLLDDDLGHDDVGLGPAEAGPRGGVEVAQVLQGELDLFEVCPGGLGDPREAIGLDVRQVVRDEGAQQPLGLARSVQLEEQALAQVVGRESWVGRRAQLGQGGLQLPLVQGTGQRGVELARDGVEGLLEVAAVVQGPDQVLQDRAPAVAGLEDPDLLDHHLVQGGRLAGDVLEGLVAAIAGLGVPGPFEAPIAVVALEALQGLDHLVAVGVARSLVGRSPRLGSGLLLRLRALEEGVLDQLLLDARLQVQQRELQDLHRLDHLRRLLQTLLQASALVESESQGCSPGSVAGSLGPASEPHGVIRLKSTSRSSSRPANRRPGLDRPSPGRPH